MWRDVRFAVRLAASAKGLVAATMLTLALGTGAASTIFSLLYATVFRPLPFAQPDRIVMVYATRASPRGGVAKLRWSRPAIAALAPRVSSFDALGSYSRADVSLTGTGDPEQLQAEMISSGYLRALRVRPLAGRLFTADDDSRPGAPELGIPLRRGRLLDDGDVAGRPPVAVINETAARTFWPGEDPIGQSVWFGSAFTDPEHPVVIVGVVGDVKYWPLDQPVGPDFYTSYRQYALPDTLVLVKSRAAAAAIVPALRHAVARVDSSLPIYDVHSLADGASLALARPRFNAAVSGLFAFAAVALVVLGVYGLLSYAVASRRREFALRLALGADPRALARRVVQSGLTVASIGGLAGLVVSFGISRALRHLAYGLSATDPGLIIAIAVLVLLAATSAAAAPARRAARTNAAETLREA